MKIESFQPEAPKPQKENLSTVLRNLQSDQCLRIDSAGDYYTIMGRLSVIGKKRNIKFGSRLDGQSVLIFIKPQQP